jgi:hypothetical protein
LAERSAPTSALAEIGKPPHNQPLQPSGAMFKETIAPQAAGLVHAVFALNQEGELETLPKDAGFRHVAANAATYELALPAPRDFLWQYIESTPLASVVTTANGEARSALEREVVAGWQAFSSDGGMRYRQRVVVATARR